MTKAAGAPELARRAVTGAAVVFEDVTKSYGPHVVLRPTTLAIARGEFFAIIGPSGSGKSTLLGIIAGFAPPTGGVVRVDGASVLSLPPYRRNFGMVFQGYALFPHMTVAQNVGFPLKMRRLGRRAVAEGVRRALAMVRLEPYADRYPAQLSGGQQQRVALARAAVYDPPLLLMDEPLGALDKNLREEMQDEIKSFQAKLGATVIYVTHDQHEAAFLADRLAVMRSGVVEQVGAPRAIYERPRNRFVAGFLGEATIFEAASGLGLVTAAAAGGGALCLRPENVVIGPGPTGLANDFPSLVLEAVFTTGSVRYRVRLPDGTVLTVRQPVRPGMALHESGATVHAGWAAEALGVLED